MPGANHPELPSALRDQKRVSVAVGAFPASKGLKLFIGSALSSTAKTDPGVGSAAMPGSEARKVRLTHRELQILKLIAKGLHNREIASRLRRSIKTVEKHRQSLHSKLSTHEVAGLTRHAVSMGLAERSPRALRRLDRRARMLTSRELEILRLVAQGSGNKWIASELHRSIKTIDHHRENIMKKLNVHEVAGLTSYAASIGLV